MNIKFQHIKYLYKYMYGALACILFYSCNQSVVEPVEVQKDTFLYSYGMTDQWNNGILLADDGYILIGGGLNNDYIISKVSFSGHVVNDTVVNITGISNLSQLNKGIKLKDGSFLFNSSGVNPYVFLVAPNGKIIYHKLQEEINNKQGGFPSYIQGGDLCYCCNTNYSNSNLFIHQFEPASGVVTKNDGYDIFLKEHGDYLLDPYLYKVTSSHYWVNGNIPLKRFDSIQRKTTVVIKSIVAKLSIDPTDEHQTFIFNEESNKHEQVALQELLRNGESTIVTVEKGILQNNTKSYFTMRRIDDNLNIVWESKINLNSNSLIPRSISETSDGRIVVLGNCFINDDKFLSSFAVVISADGNMLKEHYFKGIREYVLTDIITDNQGNFIFSGYSSGFGNGKEGKKRLILKTNKEFNY